MSDATNRAITGWAKHAVWIASLTVGVCGWLFALQSSIAQERLRNDTQERDIGTLQRHDEEMAKTLVKLEAGIEIGRAHV